MLEQAIKILGWQGGTLHQVRFELARRFESGNVEKDILLIDRAVHCAVEGNYVMAERWSILADKMHECKRIGGTPEYRLWLLRRGHELGV